jgi:hypothetical protein
MRRRAFYKLGAMRTPSPSPPDVAFSMTAHALPVGGGDMDFADLGNV